MKNKREGLKNDSEKIRTDFLVPRAMLGTAEVLTFGGKKYGERNFHQGIKYSRVYGALLRHLWAWYQGEDLDKETRLNHLHHAACCIMFLQTYATHKKYKSFDDRPLND